MKRIIQISLLVLMVSFFSGCFSEEKSSNMTEKELIEKFYKDMSKLQKEKNLKKNELTKVREKHNVKSKSRDELIKHLQDLGRQGKKLRKKYKLL